MSKRFVAGVEGGGTSWKVCLGTLSPDGSRFVAMKGDSYKCTVPTGEDPNATLGSINAWLLERRHLFYAVGIACFGPVDLDKDSSSYGSIRANTPKKAWRNVSVIDKVMAGMEQVPVGFDTDVNAPALSEFLIHVAPQGKTSCAYVTVGTGIGVGLVINGQTVRGLMHPEGGHISVPGLDNDAHNANDPSMNCKNWHDAECLGSKLSIERRVAKQEKYKNKKFELKDVGDDNPVWDTVAHYIGALCANLVLMVSPERIVLGGGIMQRESIFPKIQANCMKMLNGYVDVPELMKPEVCASYITKADADAGLVGAFYLADLAHKDALKEKTSRL